MGVAAPARALPLQHGGGLGWARIRGEAAVNSGGCLGAVTWRADLSLSRIYCRFYAHARVYYLSVYVSGTV